MDHAVNGRVRLEHGVERCLVRYIGLVERRPAAADELDAVERDLGRVVQVVDDDDIIVVLEERERRERANVAGATVRRVPTSVKTLLTTLQVPTGSMRRRCLLLVGGGAFGDGSVWRGLAYPVTSTVPTTMVADVCLRRGLGEKRPIGFVVVVNSQILSWEKRRQWSRYKKKGRNGHKDRAAAGVPCKLPCPLCYKRPPQTE